MRTFEVGRELDPWRLARGHRGTNTTAASGLIHPQVARAMQGRLQANKAGTLRERRWRRGVGAQGCRAALGRAASVPSSRLEAGDEADRDAADRVRRGGAR